MSSVKVAGRLQSDNGELLHHAALAGLGILRTSEIAASEDLASGALVRVMPDHEMASNAAVWAVYPSAKHVLPRLRVFLDHLAECCRGPGTDASDTAKQPEVRPESRPESRPDVQIAARFGQSPPARLRGSAGG